MLTLPDAVPVTVDLRSPGRFLLSLGRHQWRTLVVGMALGVVWTLAQALTPWAVGRTVDAGVATHDGAALTRWCALLLGLGLVQTGSGVLRHRFAVANWMQGSFRSRQLVGHHVADAGTAVTAGATTGEVVSTVANDAHRVGDLYDVSQRFAGAVVAFFVVAVLLLRLDLELGLVVLLGVPAVTAGLALVVRPLNARQQAQRDAEGKLTALGSDTVAGLRVLRGIGGEAQFVARYRTRSQAVRVAGVRIAGVQATLDAAQLFLPGLFVVVLTWLGAHAALAGRLSPGGLVTVYGYAAFLVMPLATAVETLGKVVRARVGAQRIMAVLRRTPAHATSPGTAPEPPAGAVLVDPASGLRVEPGLLTAVVATVPDEAAALAYRLARLDDDRPADDVTAAVGAAGAVGAAQAAPAGPAGGGPRLGDVPVQALPVDVLRRRVLVSEAEPRLFTGTLRSEIDPTGRHRDGEVLAALQVADAHDVLESLPDGLDARVEERGRSFSGGQRQRLVLARAVLTDPEVLVLVEPTSAVDAHTESRVALRLAQARTGRTTVVTTASPLLLDHADRVAFLVGGVVVAEGTHRDLLHTVAAYRDTVIRGEDR